MGTLLSCLFTHGSSPAPCLTIALPSGLSRKFTSWRILFYPPPTQSKSSLLVILSCGIPSFPFRAFIIAYNYILFVGLLTFPPSWSAREQYNIYWITVVCPFPSTLEGSTHMFFLTPERMKEEGCIHQSASLMSILSLPHR